MFKRALVGLRKRCQRPFYTEREVSVLEGYIIMRFMKYLLSSAYATDRQDFWKIFGSCPYGQFFPNRPILQHAFEI